MDKVICSDAADALTQIEDGSIDLVVTDPPYALTSITKRFGKPGSAPAKEAEFNRHSVGFMGKEWDAELPSVEIWEECLRVLKPGAFAFVMCSPRQDSLLGMILSLQEAGFNIGFSSMFWAYANGFPKASDTAKLVHKRLGQDDHPEDPQAQALQGSYVGFQPKPAIEVIIVVMKPLDHKTYLDQALDNGKGVAWLDDCRIPHQGGGYVPANLLVSDDVLDDGKRRSGGVKTLPQNRSPGGQTYRYSDANYRESQETQAYEVYSSDEGSFSRHFDLDKWWVKKIGELPPSVKQSFPTLITPKAPKKERWMFCSVCNVVYQRDDSYAEHKAHAYWCEDCQENTGDKAKHRGHALKANLVGHPTQKPVALFSYLITLGSRQDDIILDPFAGSGTLGVAARLLNRRYMLIERDEIYTKIIKVRLDAVRTLF